MHYLLAFDKFKSAITSDQACSIAKEAILESDPGATVSISPLTDGGEGFASVIASVLNGSLHEVEVPGPRFTPTKGKFALVEVATIPLPALIRLELPGLNPSDRVAFVEMASASGYECLSDEERNPWETTTYGTGVLIKAAVDAGARAVVLGIGGSATNDCGAGALEALGVAYYDRELQQVTNVTPGKFKLINTVGSTSHLIDAFPPVRIACDVSNPLLGENGATHVFGPQKGLKPEDRDNMERNMRKMGSRILGLYGRNPGDWDGLMAEPGAGAAGGIGFALRHALPDSSFVEGFLLVSEILNLSEGISKADCILTGEGRFDKSSLAGKGPFSLLKMAGQEKAVNLFCGSADPETVGYLSTTYPNLNVKEISYPDWPLEKSLRETPDTLKRAVLNLIKAS